MNDQPNQDQPPAPTEHRFNLPWADIVTRVLIWLLLGIAINLLPSVFAYFIGPDPSSGGDNSFAVALSSGDLLIATTAILPPTLADLAINVRKARRTRTIVVVVGGLICLTSLAFYGLAFENYLSRESGKAMVARHLSLGLVADLSVVFFLCAVVLGAVCAGFLALNESVAGGAK